jgi:hypothetical protein
MEAWKDMPFPAALAGVAQLRAIIIPTVCCMISVLNQTSSLMAGQVSNLEYSIHAISSLRLHTSVALNCFVFKDVMTTFTFTLLLGNLIQEKNKTTFLHKLIEQFTLKD